MNRRTLFAALGGLFSFGIFNTRKKEQSFGFNPNKTSTVSFREIGLAESELVDQLRNLTETYWRSTTVEYRIVYATNGSKDYITVKQFIEICQPSLDPECYEAVIKACECLSKTRNITPGVDEILEELKQVKTDQKGA